MPILRPEPYASPPGELGALPRSYLWGGEGIPGWRSRCESWDKLKMCDDLNSLLSEREVIGEPKGPRFGLVSGDGAVPNPDEVDWLPAKQSQFCDEIKAVAFSRCRRDAIFSTGSSGERE